MNLVHLRNLIWARMAIGQLAAVDALAQPTHPGVFESEIMAFERADKIRPPPHHPILFTGSSSIRKWTSLARDFKGHHVMNRGFGGSQMSDLIYYADRIVIPYHPQQIVFFEGSNDLDAGKTPEQVFDDFKTFVEKVRAALPNVEMDYLAITTSPLRWRQVD